MAPPGPVKIGHKKDGHQRRPHRFHVSRPPPYPVAGSATELLSPHKEISTLCNEIQRCQAPGKIYTKDCISKGGLGRGGRG